MDTLYPGDILDAGHCVGFTSPLCLHELQCGAKRLKFRAVPNSLARCLKLPYPATRGHCPTHLSHPATNRTGLVSPYPLCLHELQHHSCYINSCYIKASLFVVIWVAIHSLACEGSFSIRPSCNLSAIFAAVCLANKVVWTELVTLSVLRSCRPIA